MEISAVLALLGLEVVMRELDFFMLLLFAPYLRHSQRLSLWDCKVFLLLCTMSVLLFLHHDYLMQLGKIHHSVHFIEYFIIILTV